jgi:hypothetical protein
VALSLPSDQFHPERIVVVEGRREVGWGDSAKQTDEFKDGTQRINSSRGWSRESVEGTGTKSRPDSPKSIAKYVYITIGSSKPSNSDASETETAPSASGK